jgi:hypothetical protein
MIDRVDYYLAHDEDRETRRVENAEWTRVHHTYAMRMKTVLEVVLGDGADGPDVGDSPQREMAPSTTRTPS